MNILVTGADRKSHMSNIEKGYYLLDSLFYRRHSKDLETKKLKLIISLKFIEIRDKKFIEMIF